MLAGLRVLAAVLLTLMLVSPSLAQNKPTATPTDILNGVEKDLKAIDQALDQKVDEAKQRDLRDRAVKDQDALNQLQGSLQEQLDQVDAKIAGLGPVMPDMAETDDIRAERDDLGGQRSGIDAAIKRARLLTIEAQQLTGEIDRNRVAALSEKLMTRSPSPFEPAFWQGIASEFPRDLRRAQLYFVAGWKQVVTAWDGSVPWEALLGLALAIAVLFPLRWATLRFGQRFLIEGAPGHRVRRSANAVWRVVVGTFAPLIAILSLGQGLEWSGLMPDRWSGLFDALTMAIAFASYTASLGSALLMPSAPSWRLFKMSDKAAVRLRAIPRMLAAFAALSIVLEGFNREIGASASAALATQALSALLYLLLIGLCLLILARLRTAWADSGEGESTSTSAWIGAATLLAWVSVTIAFAALLMGYVGFSLFVAHLITWATVLTCSAYLLMVAIDDLATSLFTKQSPLGRTLTRAMGIRGSVVDQFGVVVSGVLRAAIALMAVSMLITPFGAGGGLGVLYQRIGALGSGVEIGGISISFDGILRGVMVLVLGLAAVRLLMRWLEHTYLPVTGWDDSGRNSFGLIARYVAISLAGVWALASLGIGVEKLALLLSALSVGIGFGLQAITQNFVSGLILLAERPIKIGDLVRVGTDEGDVKRINVRSTEIVLADHSTLIVPNSELITKTVLNKTLASPLGRVQLQFSVPIGTDPGRVRALVVETFAAETAILNEPKPSVFIDDIADGRIMFNGFAHVANPRTAYGARSNVLMTMLQRFRDEGIEIGTIPQRLELVQLPATDETAKGG